MAAPEPSKYPTYGPTTDLKLIRSQTYDKLNLARTLTPVKSSELPSIPREAKFSV